MIRNFYTTIIFAMLSSIGFAQTSLSGKITDSETGGDLIGANIVLMKNKVYKAGSSTDFDGNYSMSVEPGTYDVEVSYIGYPPKLVTEVVVNADYVHLLNVQLGDEVSLTGDVVIEYKAPPYSSSDAIVTYNNQIRNHPSKNVDELTAQIIGLSSADQVDDISLGNGRANGTSYYIDGIRVSDNSTPKTKKQSKRRCRIRNIFKKQRDKKLDRK